MAFSNSATDLSKIIALTTFLGDADNLLRKQTAAITSFDLEDVKYASTSAIAVVGNISAYAYSNGTLGDGATITFTSSSNTFALDVDTIDSTLLNARLLIKNQTNAAHNGVYYYESMTPSGGNFIHVLKRVVDFNLVAEMKKYTKIRVTNGSVNQGKIFFLDSTVETVGTSNLVFSQYPAESTSQFLISEFRKQFDEFKSESEFDNIRNLINTTRTVELNLASSVNNQFSTICTALNSFYTTQYGNRFKVYFSEIYDTGIYDTDLVSPETVWSDNFRTLWRNTINEELVVRLGFVTKSAGAWQNFSTTGSKSIVLDSTLVLKIKQANNGAEPIPVTVALKDSANNSYAATVNIPVSAAAETKFPITTATQSLFSSVTSVTVSNTYGNNSDKFEIWVSA